MPKPVAFPGSNIVIAENQEPYVPLPARIFGDSMGTILCCWEFSEEELAEIVQTKKLWSSHWSFKQPFQPMMLSTECPVREVVPEPRLTLYGFPAERLELEPSETGWKGPGWYFFDALHMECFGPYSSQMSCETAMLIYAHEKGQCDCEGGFPCGSHGSPKA